MNLNLGYIDNMSDSPKNSETLDTTPTGASNGYLERVLNDPRFAQAYVDAIRVDPMLGVPERKRSKKTFTLTYDILAEGTNEPQKLKIEINTTEHYHLLDYLDVPYQVESDWFKGEATITTYQLNELMGSKLRALYQRRKGRDLFDMWLMLEKGAINTEKVVEVFLAHCQHAKQPMTRAIFEKNLAEKAKNEDFKNEVKTLITADTAWDFEKAYEIVSREIIGKLAEGNNKLVSN